MFQKFANNTSAKFWGAAQSRGDPAKFPKWKANPAWKNPGSIEGLKYVTKIAVDEGIPAEDLPAIGGRLTIQRGSRRLFSTNARLMVIRSMAHLHTCAPGDWAHLCDLIYIVGLGVPVVVASTWRIAGGDPSRLAAHASGIASHAPALLTPCTFLLDRGLDAEHPELRFALEHCANRPKSKWKVFLDRRQPLAADVVKAATIRQLAAAIFKLRTLHADGSRGYAVNLK